MYPAHEAADPFERVAVLQFGRAAAAPREDREAEAPVRVQRARADQQRRDHRDLGIGKLPRELVLLRDLRVAPEELHEGGLIFCCHRSQQPRLSRFRRRQGDARFSMGKERQQRPNSYHK